MNTITIQRVPRFFAVVRTLALSLGLVVASLLMTPTAAHADTAPIDPTNPATPPTVSADALPTTQIDGVAWAQVVVGDTVYVAGKFSTARPAGAAPGVSTVVRNNILAYNITTGALVTTFKPSLNAQSLGITASPDGSRIYVVGDFTAVDGVGYYRAAAFSTATGAIIPSFRPILESQGRAVVATNTAVYLGGTFSSVNGQARGYIAKVNASDGSVVSWNPNADSTVAALALTPDGSRVIMGGRFSHVGGGSNYGLAAADTATGRVLPWAANQKVRDGGTRASITSLYATNDRIYGSGYVFGTLSDGNLEGIFSADPNTGNINWVEDCHGDTYSVYAVGDVVYGAGHPHYCGNIGGFPQTTPWTYHHTVAFSKAATGTITPDPYGYFNWAGTPSPSLLNWFPQYVTGSFTGQGQAAWSLSGNSKYVVVGGEFPYVNGVAQAGLTRFAVSSIAPNKVGPNINTALVPTVVSFKAGEARVSWTSTYDQDNKNLTYSLVRDKSSNVDPIYTTTQDATFWQRVNMGFIDKGLTPGSTHTYRIFVTDPFGNSVSRLSASVTVASTNSDGAYASSVAASNPSSYWPLNESSGTTGFDHTVFNDLVVGSGVSRGAIGPVTGNNASTFNGTTSGTASTQTAIVGPDTFTTEAWVNTTSTAGGKIIGFGASSSGNSSSYDRMIYMDNAGKIYFGVYPGSPQTVSSSASFNDGQWHQVDASLGSNGMRLYVDGNVVGSRTDVTSGQAYSGYWRIGGDNLGGWPSQPSSNYLNGSIGQVAIYPSVLTRQELVSHFVASGRTSPMAAAPSDAYGAAVYNNDPTLYWRLGESTGSAASDSGQQEHPGTYAGGVTQGVPGALSGVNNSAASFGAGSGVSSNAQFNNPVTYSLETWFNTTTTVGGKLIGFGDAQTGQSSSYDRHVYMQDDGTLVFGTYTGQLNTITSGSRYNDGNWHYAVATQSSDGMKLYVDGVLVGTNLQTGAQNYSGYWRVGGDTTWGSSSPWFNGKLDEVAVYSNALSAQDIANHYSLGTSAAAPNVAPTAAFTTTVDQLTAAFNGTTSADSDGTVASYAWNFGDGQTGTGATPTHLYAASGTFTATLTVTDNRGATGTSSHPITVIAANVSPTAAFTSGVSNLTASFDASASADSDGTVASYAWTFGDGQTGSGATVSHSYAAAGTYTVSLTVTDNQGATGSVNHAVSVAAAGMVPKPDHVVVVVMENRSSSSIIGNTAAPYINSLATGGALMTQSFGVIHPSEPNYLALFSGSTQGLIDDSCPHTYATANLADQLKAKALSFAGYSEDLPSVGYTGCSNGNYVRKHNPWVDFPSVPPSANQPLSTFPSDYTTLPTVSFVIPNLQDDMHDGTIAAGDAWLQSHLGAYVTWAKAHNSLLVLTWDEDDNTANNHIATIFTGQRVQAGQYAQMVNHYSVLRTMQDAFGLSSNDGSAATTAITNIWTPAGPTNQPPVAAFTSTPTNLSASFDGSGSADPDGTVTSYSWDFGDGSALGTGVAPLHTYAVAGPYQVKLTVTDNQGGTGSVTHPVTVTAPAGTPFVVDTFGRILASGWGSADTGGTWSGSTSSLSVGGGTGKIRIAAAGTGPSVYLPSTTSTDADVTVTMSSDKAGTGSGVYLYAVGRRVTGAGDYRLKTRLGSDSVVRVSIVRTNAAGAETVIATEAAVPGYHFVAGDKLSVRFQVTGTSPTKLKATVWPAATPEPATWLLTGTDSTAVLQVAGNVGFMAYLSGAGTNAPVTASVDDLYVRPTTP